MLPTCMHYLLILCMNVLWYYLKFELSLIYCVYTHLSCIKNSVVTLVEMPAPINMNERVTQSHFCLVSRHACLMYFMTKVSPTHNINVSAIILQRNWKHEKCWFWNWWWSNCIVSYVHSGFPYNSSITKNASYFWW